MPQRYWWNFAGGCLMMFLLACSSNPEKTVDELFAPYRGDDKPGAAVLVISEGKPLLTRCYGMADIEKGIPVTPATNFRLASVSKQFTAAAIQLLVEEDKLDYDTTLRQIFPDFPDYAKSITIRNILQHTSGLIAYEDLIPDSATVPVKDRDVLEMMKTQDSTYFTPGSAYRYSNTGYAVLAMVVEKLSGQSFAEFLHDRIFQPLGMDSTVAFEKGISEVPQRAYGYAVHADSIEFSDQSMTSSVLGDGGIYSSLNDLFRWDQALYSEKLLSAASRKLAVTPNLETYGFGWRIDEYRGHRREHHTGSTCGFRTVIQRYPQDHFTVIILTNRRDPDVADLAERLTDIFLIEG